MKVLEKGLNFIPMQKRLMTLWRLMTFNELKKDFEEFSNEVKLSV